MYINIKWHAFDLRYTTCYWWTEVLRYLLFVHACPYSLAHSLTQPHTYSLTHIVAHSTTHSQTCSLTHIFPVLVAGRGFTLKLFWLRTFPLWLFRFSIFDFSNFDFDFLLQWSSNTTDGSFNAINAIRCKQELGS